MFDISFDIKDEDIKVLSIEKSDLLNTQIWINNQEGEYFQNKIQIDDLYERYLEYYISENEFFLKINKHNKLIGILKGRVEFKNPNIVWIKLFVIDEQFRSMGIGSKIINEFSQHFFNNYNIKRFYIGLIQKNYRALNFFEKNKFKIIRIVDSFSNTYNQENSLLILKRKL